MKKHNVDQCESVDVFISKTAHPIAFETKVKELVEAGMKRGEAEKYLRNYPVELEIYYSEYQGLFAVEAGAVEYCDVYNPYDGKLMEGSNDE